MFGRTKTCTRVSTILFADVFMANTECAKTSVIKAIARSDGKTRRGSTSGPVQNIEDVWDDQFTIRVFGHRYVCTVEGSFEQQRLSRDLVSTRDC
jgi:hypothetical protein